MTTDDEQRITELLRALPPAPEGWVRAAQELPLARQEIADVLERAATDDEFRRALAADPEATLAGAGYDLQPAVVEAIRARMADGS
jgi:hypothetical protein